MSGTLSPDLDVVKTSKGPVMTLADEFYKVGPGPSSSHTIGPMRITYDFYQRCTKLPADQLAQATGLKVHLFGSLSATGKGHGTERASLAGLVGKEPATVDPLFLDEMIAKPQQTYPVQARRQDDQSVAGRHHLRRAEGRLPASEHHDMQAHGRRQGPVRAGILFRRRRVHRVEGLRASQEGPAEISLCDDEGAAAARGERTTFRSPTSIMANEMAVSGKSKEQINAFLDKIAGAMLATVKIRSVHQGRRPARPDQAALEGGDRLGARQDEKYESDRAIGLVAACALAASEENARGHLVITAPTGGSAGVMPAIVYALTQSKRKVPMEKIREGLLAGAGRSATCASTTQPSPRRRAAASPKSASLPAMAAALIAQVDGQLAPGDRERSRVGARASSRHDLRSRSPATCRFPASSVAPSAP